MPPCIPPGADAATTARRRGTRPADGRYGARTGAEIAAARTTKLPDVWSTGVVAVWESDPDAVAAVLPSPLKPTGRPLVCVSVSQVRLPGHPLGAGSFAVAAAHGTTEGRYPPVMPMTRERALSGGREVFREPKKPGEVTVAREGDHVRATLARHGVAFVGVRGTADGPLPRPARKTDLCVTFLPAVDGSGFAWGGVRAGRRTGRPPGPAALRPPALRRPAPDRRRAAGRKPPRA